MKINRKILVAILLLTGFVSLGAVQEGVISYYILVGLILIGLISLLMKYPHWGIYLMALLFPFTYLEIVYGSLNIPYVDAISLLLFIAWAISTLYLHVTHKKRLSLKNFPGWFFMGLFVIACVLSLLNVDREFFSYCLKYLFRPIIFFYLMFVVLPFNIIDDWRKLFATLKILFVLGIGIALTGIWSLFLPTVVGFRRVVPISIFGIYPIGANHNQLAEVFIVLIPLALILFWHEKDVFWKNIYLSGAILMAGVNVLTLSRSGWIALGLQMLILILFKYRHEMKKIFTPVAVYFLAILLVPAAILMYLLVQAGITEGATLNRLKLIEVSFMLFRQNPIFGTGVGIFTQIMAQVKWYLIEYGDVLDSHGFIFKNLAETGVMGTVTFCALIFYFIYIIFKSYQQNKNNQYSWLILGFFMAVIGIFSFQLFGTSYYLVKTWLVVGLALAALKLCKSKYFA
jgi:O-antigen ligase